MTPAVGFVQRSGEKLLLAGEPYRIVGGNTYYLGYAPESVQNGVLDLAQSFAMNAVRIWAFYDTPKPPGPWDISFQYWDDAQKAPVLNDGANGLERLDRAIARAGERGIRLILTLTNNWQDFGGMPCYAHWFGIDPRNKNQFYTDERCKQAYRNYVEQIVNRRNTITGRLYRDDPAILAWELANEPRCENNGGVETLLGWVDEMSGLIKGLDANHLIAVGDEGYFRRQWAGSHALYNGGYGVSCEELLGIPQIDFGTLHLYPQIMAKEEDPAEFGLRWIREHLEAGQRASKPMLLEEYGAIANNQERDAIFDAWLRSIEELDGVGDMLWMMGLPKSNDQWYAPDDYVVLNPADAPSVGAHALRMVSEDGSYGVLSTAPH